MRKYIILFFSVLSFLFACNRSGVPDGILPPDQMTSLLTDVYLTDGRMSAVRQMPDTLYKYGTARYMAVFKAHGTDSAQFRKSYLYYCSKPQEMLDMNVKILAELQTKSDSLNKILRVQQLAKPAARPVVSSPASPSPSAGRPVSTFHPSQSPGAVPIGVQAPVAPPARVMHSNAPRPFLGANQHFRAKQDSILKAKIKENHAQSH